MPARREPADGARQRHGANDRRVQQHHAGMPVPVAVVDRAELGLRCLVGRLEVFDRRKGHIDVGFTRQRERPRPLAKQPKAVAVHARARAAKHRFAELVHAAIEHKELVP